MNGRSPIRATVTALAASTPLILVLIAEAAWIAVIAALIQEYQLRMVVLDLPTVTGFVFLGWLATRLLGTRLGSRFPTAALALTIAGAVTGVLLAPAARQHLAAGIDGLGPALGENPGGLLAGLAVLRGVAWGTTRLPLPEERLARLLGGGLVAISITAVLGAMPTSPLRDRLLADILWQGLVFVAGAAVALALTRQTINAGEIGAGWQRNPAWLLSVLVVVSLFVTLAVGYVGQVELALAVLIALVIVPLVVAGLIVGWTRRRVGLALLLLIGAAIMSELGVAVQQTQQQSTSRPNGVGVQAGPLDNAATGGAAILIVLVLAIIVVLLVREWMRRLRPVSEDVIEERFVDRSAAEPSTRRRLRSPAGGHPADAIAAYRRLLEDIAGRRGVRREPWETPREHAARLRAGNSGRLSLDLLAADYALARFGGARLSAGENNRAIRRWRTLRGQLKAVAAADRGAADDAPRGTGGGPG
jgi:hypothetical protein